MTTPNPAGPCDGWLPLSYLCCTEASGAAASLLTAAESYATTVLWAATGRRFGLCTRTVRPCGKECQDWNLGGGYFWSQGTWLPYIFNGVWRNCWCGCAGALGCCSCQPQCQVYLPGPVASVSQVTLDGAIVDPATYRVDNGIWLVRTRLSATDPNAPCWPWRQNYDLDSGTDTFIVTYQQGVPVPSALNVAAGELACEFIKACKGLPCRLPARATSIARQGVTISLADVNSLLDKGLTGVVTVDQVIRAYNPYALTSKMQIASPDLTVERTTTIP